jgi:hypothetical protein
MESYNDKSFLLPAWPHRLLVGREFFTLVKRVRFSLGLLFIAKGRFGYMKIKSSKCGNSSCVEVDLVSLPDTVQVYDEHGNRCSYNYEEWKDFVTGVKLGEFDIK